MQLQNLQEEILIFLQQHVLSARKLFQLQQRQE